MTTQTAVLTDSSTWVELDAEVTLTTDSKYFIQNTSQGDVFLAQAASAPAADATGILIEPSHSYPIKKTALKVYMRPRIDRKTTVAIDETTFV